MTRLSNSSLRMGLLTGASIAAMIVATPAAADRYGRRPIDPAAQAARAAETAATRNVAAEAAAQRTRAAFTRASQVRQQMDSVQNAARAAALAAQSLVPNGLGAGGLQVANGVATDPSLWVGANGPTQAGGTDGRTTVTIGQTQDKAILTWDSFNVGRETDLVFDQKGNTNWMALNRVTDASADPSRILGSIKADGSVYIINRNGVIFGGASQVNVRSLIASSLDIHGGVVENTRPSDIDGNPVSDTLWEQAKIAARNQRFTEGLLTQNKGPYAPPTFGDGTDLVGSVDVASIPDPKFVDGDGVTVEAGAKINTGELGQAVLLGHVVINQGVISAPGGQVLLGAGRGIALLDGAVRNQSISDQRNPPAPPAYLRGYVSIADIYGRVENHGLLESARGNVSMKGQQVTQDGVVAVTTSIQQQGSIILDATAGPRLYNVPVGTWGAVSPFNDSAGGGEIKGLLTLTGASHTSILPDTVDGAQVGGAFKPSSVEAYGERILFEDGATLYAPGANVRLLAMDNYAYNAVGDPLASRIYFGKGATLDVSGLNGVEIAMDQNSIKAELRANELRDNPVQRDSALRGETVYFDARLGEKLSDGSGVANLSGYYDLIKRDVTQFMTIGGSIDLMGTEIIAREGSTIDISGGSVHYGDGFVKRTRLIDQYGRIVPIEQAVAGVKYVGFQGDFIANHARWGVTERYASAFSRSGRDGDWQKGYDEGRSAGKLSFEAGQNRIDNATTNDKARLFEGEVRAGTIVGDYQLQAPGASAAGITDVTRIWRERPSLGTLEIYPRGWLTTADYAPSLYSGGNIVIAAGDPLLGDDFHADSALIKYSQDNKVLSQSLVDGFTLFTMVLPERWFDGKTFGHVTAESGVVMSPQQIYDQNGQPQVNPDGTPQMTPAYFGGVFTVGKGVTMNLGDYGSLAFKGRQALIDGTIKAAGGSVALQTVTANYTGNPLQWSDIPEDMRPITHLGESGVIDVSGRWTNDFADSLAGNPLTAPVVDGGTVTIVGAGIVLDKGSLIDVGGGAHLTADGKTLALGDGGAIILDGSNKPLGANGLNGPSDRPLEMNGTLAGYAPGKGGSLTIETPDEVFIGSTPVLADGVVRAGEPAPIAVILGQDTIIKAGSTLPIPVAYQVTVVPGGVALPDDTYLYIGLPLSALAADWTLPPDFFVYNEDYSQAYYGGETVPAGTIVPYGYGTLPSGYVVPAAVFPNGLNFGSPVSLMQPAGVVDADFTIPAGFKVPQGTVFQQDLQIVTPRTIAPVLFSQGGFSSFDVSGARGVTIQAGTVIAPTVDTLTLTGLVRDVATGTKLSALANQAGSGVTLINSASLAAGDRPAMQLTLATSPTTTTLFGQYSQAVQRSSRLDGIFTLPVDSYPGSLVMEEGASILMPAGSSVLLDSLHDVFIDGAISAPGGSIFVLPFANFEDGAVIGLGAHARLLAGGYERSTLDAGLVRHSVEAGGVIRIGGARTLSGLMIDRNAVLDVSGIHGITDLDVSGGSSALGRSTPPWQSTEVDGDAGSISLYGAWGVVAGDLELASGGPAGRGGAFLLNASQNLIVRQHDLEDAAPVTVASLMDMAGRPTTMTLIADRLDGSAVGDITLDPSQLDYTEGRLILDGDVRLAARRSVTLSRAAVIERMIALDGTASVVEIAAPYVKISGLLQSFNYDSGVGPGKSPPIAAEDLNGTLTVRAGLIDLDSLIRLDCAAACTGTTGGFGAANFISDGDIRLTPGAIPGTFDSPTMTAAGLLSSGAINFDAAQVYVTRGVNFDNGSGAPVDRQDADPGFLVWSQTSITNTSNGQAAPVPLTYGERVTLRAPEIVQAGVLRSPAGQIRLEAQTVVGDDAGFGSVAIPGSLVLAPGSLTSASLEGVIVPFGVSGTDRLNDTDAFSGYLSAGASPTKSITLAGATVDVQSGAIVDVSGGGDLLASRFNPGVGGSRDLTIVDSADPRFAIIPSRGTAALPIRPEAGSLIDARRFNDTALAVGDSVWLAGVPGLAAGYYTLMPAGYAVLDGAFLIKDLGGAFAAPIANVTRDDGAVITSGYHAVTGTTIRDAGYASFEVMDSKTWRQYSDITGVSFNKGVMALAATQNFVPRTIADAGSIVMAATETLALNGIGRLAAVSGGMAGNLDISAAKIALTGSGATAPDGYLNVDAAQLQAFGGAGSVLLGGIRPRTTSLGLDTQTFLARTLTDVLPVTTTATGVLVTAGAHYQGGELLLLASDMLTIGEGASLATAGDFIGDPRKLGLSGDSAFIRLSADDRVAIGHTPGGGVTGGGLLTVANGASLTSTGSLTFDASGALDLSRNAAFDAGQINLSALRINIGDAPANEAGTTIGVDTVRRLAAGTADLLLGGSDSIHFYGSFALGGRDSAGKADFAALTLDTPELVGEVTEGAGPVLTLGALTLINSAAAPGSTQTPGVGALTLDVDRLELGSGQMAIRGYAQLTGRVGEIRTGGAGPGNSYDSAGVPTALRRAAGSGRFDMAGDMTLAVGQLVAEGGSDFTLAASGSMNLTQATPVTGQADTPIGGKLSLSAATLGFDTLALMGAGTLVLETTQGNLALGDHAVIDAAGRAVDFRDVTKYAPGGSVTLRAAGDLAIASGASIDVSGATRGGAAGEIEVIAMGAATLAGQFNGAASAGYQTGGFVLDSGQVSDLAALNVALNFGQLNDVRSIRLRHQDIVLGAGDRIAAHQVLLRSDSGAVRIGGAIAANGDGVTPDGGIVRLIAGTDVIIDSTARIEAAAGVAQAGGFDPSSGAVELAAGRGRVTLASGSVIDVSGGRQGGGRVMVRAGRDGAAIKADLAGTVTGAREKTLVGVATYQTPVIDGALTVAMIGDAANWAAAASSVSGWDVGAGMVVFSAGTLTVSSDIDLGAIAGAGYLGLSGIGDLTINAAISDGFASASRDAALEGGRSFSYDFESGGDIRLANDALVRTGTGDIRLAAGRNIDFGNNASAIYTAGAATATVPGFDTSDYVTGSKSDPNAREIGAFPTLGGNISLSARQDILAPQVAQTPSAWLFRYGNATWDGVSYHTQTIEQTNWSIVYRNFEYGVGALGGGNVAVHAGRNIQNLAVAIPTTGQQTTRVGATPVAADLVVRGGGDLTLRSGGDLLGGAYILGRGVAMLRVGGDVTVGPDILPARQPSGPDLDRFVGPIFGLMDATATVTATGDVTLGAGYDPMMTPQVCGNLVGVCDPDAGGNGAVGSAFRGYTERAALNGIAIGGDLTYQDYAAAVRWMGEFATNPEYRMVIPLPPSGFDPRTPVAAGLVTAPGTMRLTALSGDMNLVPLDAATLQLTLAAAPTGTLEVLAGGGILTKYASQNGTGLTLEDVGIDYIRDALRPTFTQGASFLETILIPGYDGFRNAGNNNYRGFTPLHVDDAEPLRLIALDGSILNGGKTMYDALFFITSPKPVDIYASADIVGPNIVAQNNRPDQVSQVVAGRDLLTPKIDVLGAGQLWVEAGHDIRSVVGITSRGNGTTIQAQNTQGNLALADTGADVTLIAGASQGEDYDAFAKVYLDPAKTADSAFPLSHPANADKVVHTYTSELVDYLKEAGLADATPANARALFEQLPAATQKAFLQTVLLAELKETGIDYNDPKSLRYRQYARGYDAMARMFPATAKLTGRDNPAGGNITLFDNPVDSLSGGSINIIAPYGGVVIGDPARDRAGDGGGVTTRRGGNVGIVANGSIGFGLSRAFTLQGGDMLLWTSYGDITAGAGAKTSVSNVPPAFKMDRAGNVMLDLFGLQTGAGIGVLDAFEGRDPNRRPSRLDLLAFNGEVNAGDAGIRVVGDLNIAALRVVNAANIEVSGDATGIPIAAAVNVGALTSASSAASAVTNEAVRLAERARPEPLREMPTILNVRFLGFGPSE